MKYREKFGYTHEYVSNMSMGDLLKDLEMMSIEADFTNSVQQNSQKS